MQTKVLTMDIKNPYNEKEKLVEVATLLKNGEVVACPTESVYGLFANALDEDAVKKIYEAKGRPSDNPLIVHISSYDMLETIVMDVPKKAKLLMEAFWPAPLTILLKKKDVVPATTTAGLNTVGVRMPKNDIILSIIEEANLPLAAPSANVSGKPSPTCAKHVLEDMEGRIPCIVDGGDCDFGVESTIIDLSSDTPMILRPGNITISMIESVIGKVLVDATIINDSVIKEAPKAPGMKYKHYAPLCEVLIVKGENDKVVKKIYELAKNCPKKVGIICTLENEAFFKELENVKTFSIGTRSNLNTITQNLFKILRQLDEDKLEVAFCESFSRDEEGLAIMNRLVKASGHNILEV